ncbi:fasciclin-3 isoform X2 [Chrysoperla carnea]|uniref:fasciclin-3 isoform X2 n=1 Tax=Chrysoperla carnea TaxID=189513 RepID=UPI001D060C86|nr:fasciclin-3 isoform X2 [Chrysoperla carnea]
MWKKKGDMQSVVLAVIITFLASFRDVQPAYVEVEPSSVIALPGQTVEILCKVPLPLQYCRIVAPGFEPVNLHPKATETNNNGLKYFGAGLAAGHCGATITRITDKNNGIINCTMGTPNEVKESAGHINLLVAKPPKAPELDVNRGSEAQQIYRAGDVLQAACYIRDGRPAANISWYLDNDLLVEGLNEPIIINGLDDLQTVQQNLTRRLSPQDDSKQLRCVANHIALNGAGPEAGPNAGRTYQSSIQLNVKYAPQPPSENPIDLFDYELGKPGVVSVEFTGNPRPSTHWTIDGVQVKEGTADPTGRFEAASPEDLGRGTYKANLFINNIKKEDTETQFRLTAYNDQGSTDYFIVLSTNAEPQGLELGVGPIIGIVVSILLVLLIIFLVIYARASGRWCFGGAASNNQHYESDTESANVEAHKKKRFDNLKSIFKKKNETPAEEENEDVEIGDADTLQEEDVEITTPTQVTGEKKDGIVYAELDLVKTNAVKPIVKKEDEKTEYAEIIYTKNETSPTSKPNETETH